MDSKDNSSPFARTVDAARAKLWAQLKTAHREGRKEDCVRLRARLDRFLDWALARYSTELDALRAFNTPEHTPTLH